MTPSQRRRRFVAAVRREARRRGKVIDEGALKVLESLLELQEQTRQVLGRQPTDFDAHRLPQVEAEVRRLIGQWVRRAVGDFEAGVETAWDLGPEIVTRPLAAAEVPPIGMTVMPQSLLDELKAFGVEKIQGLGPVAEKRILSAIRSTVLGGQSPFDAMKAIGTSLNGQGPFRLLAFREETIYRTEMGRIHSITGQRRQEDAARVIPGLGKQWLWSRKGRSSHGVANGQVRPVDEPFLVGGERLMYPRDPGGSAENTINCGCESVPYKDDWK